MSGQPQDRRDLEVKLIARAWKDPKFADDLRRTPKAVVERELAAMRPGAKLPAGLDIRVVEETPNTIYLVVPRKPQAAAELSEAELAQVAGGWYGVGGVWHSTDGWSAGC